MWKSAHYEPGQCDRWILNKLRARTHFGCVRVLIWTKYDVQSAGSKESIYLMHTVYPTKIYWTEEHVHKDTDILPWFVSPRCFVGTFLNWRAELFSTSPAVCRHRPGLNNQMCHHRFLMTQTNTLLIHTPNILLHCEHKTTKCITSAI